MESASEQSAFWGLHAAWLAVSVLSAALLARRPNPRLALGVLVLMHALAFLGYYANLGRPYAIGVSHDRAIGVGMAMAVADGGSPFDHVQVEFGNLEPLWTFFVAVLSGFSADRVPALYDRMTLLVLTLTALGFYRAWSIPRAGEDADVAGWRGVLVAAGVLGLSSFSMSPEPPVQIFWQGNFVFKPNHALAFGLVGLLSRFSPSNTSWVRVGLLQGLLIWVFILDWAYLVPGLFLAAWLGGDRMEGLKRAALSTVLGLLIGLPYLLHLFRDYSPVGDGEMAQIWRDHMGGRLASPYWWSLDLGPVLILFLVALFFALRRSGNESGAVGFLATGPLVALCYVIGFQLGLAPEPDEGHYYVRMVAGAGAGYAVWSMASRLGGISKWRQALGFGIILASSVPAYFNPFLDDRYYPLSRTALPSGVAATADWIRSNVGPRSVLISADGIMLAGLTGRRFLMVRPDQTADRNDRERAERDIVTSLDPETVRRAAARYGVTHVVLDERLREKYGDLARGLGNRPWFEPAFLNSFTRILILRSGAREDPPGD